MVPILVEKDYPIGPSDLKIICKRDGGGWWWELFKNTTGSAPQNVVPVVPVGRRS